MGFVSQQEIEICHNSHFIIGLLYAQPFYEVPYHNLALAGAIWVHELLDGHPECIWCGLGTLLCSQWLGHWSWDQHFYIISIAKKMIKLNRYTLKHQIIEFKPQNISLLELNAIHTIPNILQPLTNPYEPTCIQMIIWSIELVFELRLQPFSICMYSRQQNSSDVWEFWSVHWIYILIKL